MRADRIIAAAVTQAAGAASFNRRPNWLAGRLILHGRYTCKARKPDCPRCVIRDLCRYPDKTEDSDAA